MLPFSSWYQQVQPTTCCLLTFHYSYDAEEHEMKLHLCSIMFLPPPPINATVVFRNREPSATLCSLATCTIFLQHEQFSVFPNPFEHSPLLSHNHLHRHQWWWWWCWTDDGILEQVSNNRVTAHQIQHLDHIFIIYSMFLFHILSFFVVAIDRMLKELCSIRFSNSMQYATY